MFFKISHNSQENICARVSQSLGGPQIYLKKRLWQAFSCEFYEIFKDTFFTEQLRVTASHFLPYDEVLSIRLLVGFYHYIVFMVPVKAYSKQGVTIDNSLFKVNITCRRAIFIKK